ncbi:MAG: hypothetical protein DCC67_09835 [Planctomycetota bacterium]|nr:MAG: hypothetical protein DCC67_09835 [Planctomycetota bacterium]
MSPPRPSRTAWQGLWLLAAAGCQAFIQPPDAALESLLKPVTTSPESVTLELFHARIPLDKDHDADAFWQQVDEQRFSVELRRELVANGLRAGVVGAPLPSQLSDLLALESEAPDASTTRVIDGQTAVPRVTKRVLHVNRRDEKQIQASELRDEATVLLSDGGAVGGKTFREVQGVYVLRAETAAGQRSRVRLTPELQHGEIKMRYAGSDQGILLKTPSREREVFDRLALETELAPGELLVLGCFPEAKTSLGGLFHTASAAGQDERKLIVLRLVQVPPSEILAAK